MDRFNIPLPHQDAKRISDLFKEYVLCGESWGLSRVVAIHKWSRSVSREGVHAWLTKKVPWLIVEYLLYCYILA